MLMIMLGQMELVCKGKDETGQKGGGVGREERPQKRFGGVFLGYLGTRVVAQFGSGTWQWLLLEGIIRNLGTWPGLLRTQYIPR